MRSVTFVKLLVASLRVEQREHLGLQIGRDATGLATRGASRTVK